jgi:hypothetical protein
LLVLQPLLWLWPCVFGNRTFVPYDTAEYPPASIALTQAQQQALRSGTNHDVTEVPVWFLPEFGIARDELRAGRLPTWDPHPRGGAPLHAHGLIGLCYPPNWLAITPDDPSTRLGCRLDQPHDRRPARVRAAAARPTAARAAWFGATLFQLGAPMAANALLLDAPREPRLAARRAVVAAVLARRRPPALPVHSQRLRSRSRCRGSPAFHPSHRRRP